MTGAMESFVLRRHVLVLMDRMIEQASDSGDVARWKALRVARLGIDQLPQMTLDNVPWEMMAHDGTKLGGAIGHG